MYDNIMKIKLINNYIRENLGVTFVEDKVIENIFGWFKHLQWRVDKFLISPTYKISIWGLKDTGLGWYEWKLKLICEECV